MAQTTPEQSIYLKPLLQIFFRQWKILLVFMLAGALLCGAFQALVPPSTPALDTEAVAALEEQIASAEQELENNAQRRADNLETIQSKQETIREIQANISKEQDYLRLCEDTLSQVASLLENATRDAKISLLAQFTTLNDDIHKTQDTIEKLENSVTSNQDEIKRLREENLTTLPESNSVLRESLADLLSQKEALETAADPALAQRSPKKVLMFAVVGLVLGACVRALWIFIQAVTSHKLQDADEICSNYSIPLLASLKDEAGAEDACRLAAAKLKVQLAEGQEVLVTGTLPMVQLQAVCDRLQKYAAFSLRAVGNAAQDADATLALEKANVVIVESVGISDFCQINAMMQALSLCGAKCLGLVEK